DDQQTVWLTFGDFWCYKVIVTTDGGQSWTDLSDNLPNVPVNCIVRHKGTGDLYIGTDVGVYILQNQPGAHWECFSTNLPWGIAKDLQFNYCSNKLRLSLWGYGIWETDLPSSTIMLSSSSTWNSPRQLTTDLSVESPAILTIT